MKKSLIALAVLASSGAAMAQSSVTLYGLVDAYVGHTSKTDKAGAAGVKTNQNVVGTSGANNSRWGLRGTEDLGNGLKANFVLEAGFSTDTGADANTSVPAPAGTAFGRQASVGLSGDFGAVSLGRQYTAYDALRGATNNLYDTNLATTNTVWTNGIADYTNRASNSIAYTSPVFSGVSGAVVIGLGEDKATGLSATKNYSAHVKYANGPLLVGYAYQVENTRTAAVAAVAPAAATIFTPAVVGSAAVAAFNMDDRKYNLLAASYDFGVAKLTGGFNMAKQGTKKDKEFQVGVSAPFGAATVAAGYSYSKTNDGTATTSDSKGQGLSLLGTYSLSKRTTLYAGVASTKVEAVSKATDPYKTTTAAVGVRHTF